jgi:hypothetical protein
LQALAKEFNAELNAETGKLRSLNKADGGNGVDGLTPCCFQPFFALLRAKCAL